MKNVIEFGEKRKLIQHFTDALPETLYSFTIKTANSPAKDHTLLPGNPYSCTAAATVAATADGRLSCECLHLTVSIEFTSPGECDMNAKMHKQGSCEWRHNYILSMFLITL